MLYRVMDCPIAMSRGGGAPAGHPTGINPVRGAHADSPPAPILNPLPPTWFYFIAILTGRSWTLLNLDIESGTPPNATGKVYAPFTVIFGHRETQDKV